MNKIIKGLLVLAGLMIGCIPITGGILTALLTLSLVDPDDKLRKGSALVLFFGIFLIHSSLVIHYWNNFL